MGSDSLDANLVVHYLIGDNSKQRALVSEILNLSGVTHYFTDIAISETIYVLEKCYEMPRIEITDQLGFFLARYAGRILYNQALTKLAFPVYLEHPKLSWNDCTMAAEAELNHHEPLFTFDRKLANQLSQAKLLEG